MPYPRTIALIAILIGAAFAFYDITRDNYGLLTFKSRGHTAYGNGKTDSRSYDQVIRFLDENPQINTLHLGKVLGTKDMGTNIALAREIRRRGLKTQLGKRSVIASGGVSLFLAGVERNMECGALIGVHSWSIDGGYGTGSISPTDLGYDTAQRFVEQFHAEMGVEPGFYEFTRSAAEPEGMYYLTTAEINKYGLLSQDQEC